MNVETITQKINSKTERVKKLQEEIKSLETKRTQLENEKILKTINEVNIPISKLENILKVLKERKGTL